MFRSLSSLALSLALLFGGLQAGCTPPCEALAEQICACELNLREEDACREAIRAASAGRTPTEAEDQICEARLDGCTCEALERGELAACGLAK